MKSPGHFLKKKLLALLLLFPLGLGYGGETASTVEEGNSL